MIYRDFDWKNPDYASVFEQRAEFLLRIRSDPSIIPDLKLYYREHPADFINDFGVTYDPRNLEIGLPAIIPFVLFQKQIDWIDWVLRLWKERKKGLCEKSRDMGVSWTAVGLSCTLCLFYENLSIGFTSREEKYVDDLGNMKALLPKARVFLDHLPEEFRGGFVSWRDAPKMNILIPHTGSTIAGEAGKDIGRGDRRAIYFVDEFAHFERPQIVEASLSQTSNCRIDMSSVRGLNNAFAIKRHSNKVDVFLFDWKDDPRKDEAWYAKQCAELDPVVVAQEIDRDYGASVSGIVIPAAWLRSCVDACAKLGIEPTGGRFAALDVADEGNDLNAWSGRHGVEIQHLEEWSGKGIDIFETTQRAVNLCDEYGYDGFRYDADGLGADVRGDVRVINEKRVSLHAKARHAVGWRGSEAVVDPDGIVDGTQGIDSGDKGRTNKDFFKNRKAQGWWALRRRAQKTHRWVTEGVACHPDDIFSISPKCKDYLKLIAELSQPTYKTDETGKIVINKKPDGLPSPNKADSVMINFAPGDPTPMVVSRELLQAVRALPRTRRH